MKKLITILVLMMFMYCLFSCSGDDNRDLKEQDKEIQKEPEKDFTSQEYVFEILVGNWVSTEISADGLDWVVSDDMSIILKDNLDYVFNLKDMSVNGKYVFLAATEESNVKVILDIGMIFEIYSYENNVVEGVIDYLGTTIYFKMKKR